MKKIICELCDGAEFVKDGGMFICQGCGTKYTLEEARGMMKEIEDGTVPTPAPTQSPVTETTAPTMNSQQIENLLVLARTALSSCNNKETEGYCNKIIEIDVTCYEAWLMKGQAIGWQSTFSAPRVEEGANTMRKAVEFAPEEEKENVARKALIVIKGICDGLCDLAKDNFKIAPTEENRLKFGEFLRCCSKATDLFENISDSVTEYSISQWKQHKRENARLMNIAGVAALDFVREKWGEIERPNANSFSTYLDWLGEIDFIFKDSISFGESVDEDSEAIITRYNNRIIAIEEPMDACSWDQQWQSWSSSYVWVEDKVLSDEAKEFRRKQVSECRNEIRKIKAEKKRKAEEEIAAAEAEKKARIDAYWDLHSEEKGKLDAEKLELEEKKREISSRYTILNKSIKDISEEKNEKTASEEIIERLKDRIVEMNIQKSSLGVFAAREKRQITEDIKAYEDKILFHSGAVLEERKAKEAEVNAKLAPINEEKDALDKEYYGYCDRIKEIENILENIPEE